MDYRADHPVAQSGGNQGKRVIQVKLSGKQIRFLRGQGHNLRATIHIGKGGLAEPVLRQIEEGLSSHELIKVKVLQTCATEKGECARLISEATQAVVAQMVGHTLLLYRPHPDQPVLVLPGVG